MEKENAPPSSRPKLSLTLKRRFAALEREEVDQYSLVKAPKHTEQSNNWATSNFEEWRRDYNGRNPHSEIRRDISGSMDCQELDEVLSMFIVETWKENREKYPLRMLYQLLRTASLCFATSPRLYFIWTWTYLSFVLASYLLPFTNKSPGQFI